jgi:hypothetical protein
VRTVFSDEAGTGNEADEPIFVVAAVVIDGDHQWPAIDMVVRGILDTYVFEDRRANFEFKAARLFGQLSKHEGLLREFVQIVDTFQLPIAWCAIDRARMVKDYAQQNLTCSTEIMQNLGFSVAATQVEYLMRLLWPNERAIWLADETRANQPMKASLRKYQESVPFGAQGTRFEHIIDTVFFGSSKVSVGIQLADACNFFIKRHFMKDTSAERFFEIIHPLMIERTQPVLYSPEDDGTT